MTKTMLLLLMTIDRSKVHSLSIIIIFVVTVHLKNMFSPRTSQWCRWLYMTRPPRHSTASFSSPLPAGWVLLLFIGIMIIFILSIVVVVLIISGVALHAHYRNRLAVEVCALTFWFEVAALAAISQALPDFSAIHQKIRSNKENERTVTKKMKCTFVSGGWLWLWASRRGGASI